MILKFQLWQEVSLANKKIITTVNLQDEKVLLDKINLLNILYKIKLLRKMIEEIKKTKKLLLIFKY